MVLIYYFNGSSDLRAIIINNSEHPRLFVITLQRRHMAYCIMMSSYIEEKSTNQIYFLKIKDALSVQYPNQI